MNGVKKPKIEQDQISADIPLVHEKKVHKLVLKDASEENPYSVRSNSVILGGQKIPEEVKGSFGETLEEIIEDNEASKEEEEMKDIFSEIIKLKPRLIEKTDMKKFVMRYRPFY